jgi:hypothetical protein
MASVVSHRWVGGEQSSGVMVRGNCAHSSCKSSSVVLKAQLPSVFCLGIKIRAMWTQPSSPMSAPAVDRTHQQSPRYQKGDESTN